jgi:hypothetical protein
MTPDPKWLEILKASGWQTAALAAAFGVTLLMIRVGWIASPDPWFMAFCALSFLICLFLALASIGHGVADFFQPRVRLARWVRERRQKKVVREYIAFMTDHEKAILAYLLHWNQKTFTAASDGGYAATLISRGIVVRALVPGQMFSGEDMPLTIPDHIWDVLMEQKAQFPYKPNPRRDGAEAHPWRVHWMAR